MTEQQIIENAKKATSSIIDFSMKTLREYRLLGSTHILAKDLAVSLLMTSIFGFGESPSIEEANKRISVFENKLHNSLHECKLHVMGLADEGENYSVNIIPVKKVEEEWTR